VVFLFKLAPFELNQKNVFFFSPGPHSPQSMFLPVTLFGHFSRMFYPASQPQSAAAAELP
jgi:hypothetical protein